MFERELTDSLFLQRWSIVRTIRPQSVAEHTFLVAHFVNDIACLLALPQGVHLSLLQYALWHDAKDEIFTSDLPGPNKRGLLEAIGPEAKEKWEAKLDAWANKTFKDLGERSGNLAKHTPYDQKTTKLVLKCADWMESSIKMATETQLGNNNTTRHIETNMAEALENARLLIEHLYSTDLSTDEIPFDVNDEPHRILGRLSDAIEYAVLRAGKGNSAGPWITQEDELRL